MSLLQSILLGILQGLTEFLPVSSSGHLMIMQKLLNVNTDTGLLFEILLHLGTLVAIFVAFFKDIKELVYETFVIIGNCIHNAKCVCTGKRKEKRKIIETAYQRFVLLILISTIPTGIIGFFMKDLIENTITTLMVPGLCLVLPSVLLVMSDRYIGGEKDEQTTRISDAVFLGIAQGVATIPGLSRSGTTITACLSRGFRRDYAVRYSFIMSIPAVLGAAVLEIKDITKECFVKEELVVYLVGTAVAAIVGYFCIKTMLVLVRGKKFTYFAIYCFIVGVIAVVSSFLV